MASTLLARRTWDQGKESLWAAACNASASRGAILNLSGRRPRIRRSPMLSEPIVSIGGPSKFIARVVSGDTSPRRHQHAVGVSPDPPELVGFPALRVAWCAA